MLKRLSIAMWILMMLSACSVAQSQPAPTGAPTPVALSNTAIPATTPTTPPATPTAEPTATPVPDLPALWVIDGALNRLVAVDSQTGTVLNTISRTYAAQVTSSDERWSYFVDVARQGEQWNVALVALDLARSRLRRISLTTVPASYSNWYSDLAWSNLVLSRDNRQVFVTQSEKIGAQWITRVYIVDVTQGKLMRSIEVYAEDVAQGPPHAQAALLSSDETKLLLPRNRQVQPPPSKNAQAVWASEITILNLGEGKVEYRGDVPGEISAHGFWLSARLSPNGQTLYLLQEIVRNSAPDGYRFVAFDMNRQAHVQTHMVEQSKGGDSFCTLWGLRFTSDGRYLYSYCTPDHPIRPAGYFQYLDTQTGRFDPKVVLERKVTPSDSSNMPNIWQSIASPDNKFVYVVGSNSKEVFAFDVAKRAVVRSTILKYGQSASTDPWQPIIGAVANWFVGTASAKFYPQPGLLLSPDGQRLYAVHIQDFEHGSGLWVVETSTLKMLGHWLNGQSIYGIQLSADGRELYAASPNDYAIYVLDALTGETRRALKQEKTVFKPMGFVTAQN